MYTQAHLRFCEALAVLGKADGFGRRLRPSPRLRWTKLSPTPACGKGIAILPAATQAFRDRYQASAKWDRVRAGSVGAEAGWRIYSGGPGLFVDLLIRRAAGRRRRFGKNVNASLGSAAGDSLVLETNAEET